MNVVVDSLLTHYELSGKGQLVLLLHGWGDNLEGFKDLRASLAKKYQVLALDLPGFGDSQPPQVAWNLDNYAAFLHELLKKLELKDLHAVIGHSNGGAAAIRALALGNLKPDKLILIAASGIRNSQSIKRLSLKVLAKTGNVATVWMPERYRQGLRKSLYGAAGSDMLVMPELEETFKRTVRQDVQDDAAKLELPTLLIYAKDDRAVPLSDGERYKQLIKNSRLEVIGDSGHFVHLDQPEKVLKLCMDFLN